MIGLKFSGTKDLDEGIRILSKYLDFTPAEDGAQVKAVKSDGALRVSRRGGKCEIAYGDKTHFFRGLGILIEEMRVRGDSDFEIVETPQFDKNGGMFDFSRNAVGKPSAVKLMLERCAMMGLNTMYLYLEDTYEVPGQPYFGYMRGRYGYDELKEIDDHADIFGIEVIPAIQTLAHLSQFLKWDATRYLQDNGDTLLVDSAETYIFVEQMLRAASAPFRSRRVHVGMDEAHSLGLGNYLNRFGLRPKIEIMLSHLRQVRAIADKLGLSLMIWSDTFMNAIPREQVISEDGAEIPQSVLDNYPRGINLVNWDYGTHSADFFASVLKTHQRIDPHTVFAGGIWIWRSLGTNYGATFLNANEALTACKRVGVREVMATMWGDDGGENNIFSTLLGLQLYAEHGFAKEVSEERLKQRVLTCTGIPYEHFMALSMLDEVPGVLPQNPNMNNPGKFLLFEDVLLGLFDKQVEGLPLAAHYRKTLSTLKKCRDNSRQLDHIFETPEKLAAILVLKCDMGHRLKAAYDCGDKAAIRQIAEKQIPVLIRRVKALRLAHRKQWFDLYKPFGWEVLDYRYGGLAARLETVALRLLDHVEGRIDRLEELEQERLTFHGRKSPDGKNIVGGHTRFGRIYTACST